MSKEIKPQCLMGNGDCPPECPNHKAAKRITEKLGKKFNPNLSRLNVVFGDIHPEVNIVDVSTVINNCLKENNSYKKSSS